ncbi:MAG TPA: hypothetical protein DCE23_04445 [Firmicutes bacterium]|nr:hypothetical protein [Bacillota bacterium]
MESKLSDTKERASEYRKEIAAATKKKFKLSGIDDVKKGIKDINKNITKFGSRLSNLVLGAFVFNVLSRGLGQLQSKFTSLLKTDDQFSSSLNQIKANLMTAFTPIYQAILPAINALMNGLSKITGTIATFTASLFGKSVKETTKDAKKLSSSLKDVSESGEEASGGLSSLDNLEVIGGNDSKGRGSSATKPDVDFSGEIQTSQTLLNFLNDIKDFILENQELILGFLFGIAAALIAIKLGVDLITATGIFLLVGGLIGAIASLITYLNDPTWENFWKMIQFIGIAILGLGIILGNVPLIVIGAAALIWGTIAKHWDKINDLLQGAVDWIFDHLDDIKKKFGIVGEIIAVAIAAVIKVVQRYFGDMFKGIKQIVDGIIKIFKGDFKGGIADVFGGLGKILLAPFNALWDGVKVILNFLIDGINKLTGGINKLSFDIPDWVPVIGGQKWGFDIPKIPKLARGAVIPPRQEFMAILGDQKHGTNIEAPLDTIKDALREVMNEKGMSSQEKEIVLRNLTLIAQFGTKEFKKIVIDSIRLVEQELGKPLLLN